MGRCGVGTLGWGGVEYGEVWSRDIRMGRCGVGTRLLTLLQRKLGRYGVIHSLKTCAHVSVFEWVCTIKMQMYAWTNV